MNFQEFKESVIAVCAKLGISEYELYYQVGGGTEVSIFRHEINDFSASLAGGVCFRCIADGKMGYASTQILTEESANAIVNRAIDNAKALETDDVVFLGKGGQEYETPDMHSYDLPTTDALISTALDTQEKLYTNEGVIDGCQVSGLAQRTQIDIYNSNGLDLHYDANISGLVAVAVVSNGTEMENSFELKLGKLDEIDTTALTAKAAKSAMQKLGGDVAPTGQYPVVFSPEAMSALLQTYSSVFSSEDAQQGLSKLAGKEGSVIASPIVTLVDDPFYKDNPLPIHFDSEGSPTHKKNIIENGKLNTLLYNLKTAYKAGKKTTGNASKGSYSSAISISPFTMYLAGGDMTEAELLQQVGCGVYIHSLGGLHAGADPISGDFSLQSGGFMIENGVKTTAVKSFTVAGNFYDLLKNITAVANNVELPMATDFTAFGAPSTRVDHLSIAGK